jgi:hypothetical protein
MAFGRHTFEADVEEMLKNAGIDPNADVVMEGDLSEHLWVPKQQAVFGCDEYIWICERCGRDLRIMKKSSELEDEEKEEKPKLPDEWESLDEAMKREEISLRCCDEVITDVMTR